MTIVEIVFTMIRAALIITFFMVAIILIRRTFSKAKSGRNRQLVEFLKVFLGFTVVFGIMRMFDYLIDYIFHAYSKLQVNFKFDFYEVKYEILVVLWLRCHLSDRNGHLHNLLEEI